MQTADFSNDRVLVTGASGFIGSHLCRRLRGNTDLHGVSRRPADGFLEGARWWQADLADADAVRKLFADIRPTIVFHLASQVVGARAIEQVRETFRGNLQSTVNLLTAASENGCRRVVLAGSMEEPAASDPQPVPCSPYAAAKWAATGYARMFHALYHLETVVLRTFMVYGPGQRDTKKLVPYVILSWLRGQSPLLSGGTRKVDWIYVDDVAEAFLRAGHVAGIAGKTLDVGSGQPVAVRAVVERIAARMKPSQAPAFGAVAERPFEQERVADVALSQSFLGWRPRASLDEGLQETIHWYEQHQRELP